jgi:hypothetical protein
MASVGEWGIWEMLPKHPMNRNRRSRRISSLVPHRARAAAAIGDPLSVPGGRSPFARRCEVRVSAGTIR